MLLLIAIVTMLFVAAAQSPQSAPLIIDYPQQDSLFPPDFAPPVFLFRDASGSVRWNVEVSFSSGAAPLRMKIGGDPLRVGPIDPRCTSATNELPQLTPQQAASRTWTPDRETWEIIKRNSSGAQAVITFTGAGKNGEILSTGHAALRTSTDPVGAPIFYRDVPLMPAETENGVIKPLIPTAVPLIAWRLRNVGDTTSGVVMEDQHTCANCHSFSRDGKTLGMDLDGPQNDKGLYTIVPVQQRMTIGNQNVLSWTSFRGEFGSQFREAFMSQVSPEGRYVVTTIKPPGTPSTQFYYEANFTDYRFLQVFYPTRGILAWYDQTTRKMQPLPGADDPRYVQASAVWSPDGKYLVFARAIAKDPYPAGAPLATYANDPNEVPIQYDLYRIPFNGGKGGIAEPVVGASQNGMSNSFPKVSPDGRWIVFVKARNGQLMRPDSQLYIVPAEGGTARRMRANTERMNSWHSFSPNGRWLVFSSKSRSPYTQLFLTHIDEQGNDSPAILIENSTASNRAANIPEFVKIAPGGITKIDTPATDFYRQFDAAAALARERKYAEAIVEWKKALAMNPADARAHNNFGLALAGTGRNGEALAEYRRAIELRPDYSDAHTNLAVALALAGKTDEAIPHFRAALERNPSSAEAHTNLGRLLAEKGLRDEAMQEFRTAISLKATNAEAHNNLGNLLDAGGQTDDAIEEYRQALIADASYADAENNLGAALARKGRLDEAVMHFEKAVELRPNFADAYGNLGRVMLAQNRFADAQKYCEKALAIRESANLNNLCGQALAAQDRMEDAIRYFERAAAMDARDVETQANLGRAYFVQGRFDLATPHLERAAALLPRSAQLHSALGFSLLQQKRVAEAAAQFKSAIALDPDLGEVHYYLGQAYMAQNHMAEAIEQWRQTLRIDPKYVAALNDIAWVQATSQDDSLRNGAEAVRLATQAVELTQGRQPVALETLAAAYAEAGRFAEAVETQTRACNLVSQPGNAQMLAACRSRLAEFQAHRPLRVR